MRALVCTSAPVVHVPEKLQVELVEGVVDLLPVALHQLCVVHQLLLRTTTRVKTLSGPFNRHFMRVHVTIGHVFGCCFVCLLKSCE